jgi:hypothetical protein
MPRKSTLAMATSVVIGLTLSTAAYQSVHARQSAPATTSSSVAAASSRSTCAPKYRAKKTLVGINLSGSRPFGTVPVVRTWDTHGELRSSWPEQTRGVKRKTAMVISFRYSPQQVLSGQWDSQIRGFFKNAPKKRLIFWNFFHEPETPVMSHEFTPTQFRRAWRHVAGIAAEFCRPNLIPTLVLMGWTADPRSGESSNGGWQSWRSFYPGKRYVSVVAWDPYNFATVVPREYRAPRDLYRASVRASRSVHKRWGIAETGSALVGSDSGTKRAHWLHRVARYSRHHDAAFVTYFSSPGRVNDFRLTDAPSRRAWSQEMNR